MWWKARQPSRRRASFSEDFIENVVLKSSSRAGRQKLLKLKGFILVVKSDRQQRETGRGARVNLFCQLDTGSDGRENYPSNLYRFCHRHNSKCKRSMSPWSKLRKFALSQEKLASGNSGFLQRVSSEKSGWTGPPKHARANFHAPLEFWKRSAPSR